MNRVTVRWNGNDYMRAFEAEVDKRLARAAIFVTREVKKNLSTAVGRRKAGKATAPDGKNSVIKGQKKDAKGAVVKLRSRPGDYPFKDFGELRRSIAYNVDTSKHTARIGTNKIYAKYLELGTKNMKPRPFLRRSLKACQSKVAALIAGKKIVIRR